MRVAWVTPPPRTAKMSTQRRATARRRTAIGTVTRRRETVRLEQSVGRFPIDELGDQGDAPVRLKDKMDGQHVHMAHSSERPRLVEKTLLRTLLEERPGQKHLERDLSLESIVTRPTDHTEAALADLLDGGVTGELTGQLTGLVARKNLVEYRIPRKFRVVRVTLSTQGC